MRLVGGDRLFRLIAPHAGGAASFSVVLPNDISLVDLQVFMQGACSGAPAVAFSNALDVIVGEQ